MTWQPPFRCCVAICLCAFVLSSLAMTQEATAANPLSSRISSSRISTVKFHVDKAPLKEPVDKQPSMTLPIAKLPTQTQSVGKLVRSLPATPRIARAPDRPTKGLAALPVVVDDSITPIKKSPSPKTRIGRVVAPSTTRQWVSLYGSDYREARTPTFARPPMQSRTTPPAVEKPVSEKPAAKEIIEEKAIEPQASKSSVIYSSTGPAIRIEAIGPKQVTVGQPETYQVTLQNKSAVAARGILVRLALPKSVEVTNSSATLGEVQQNGSLEKRGLESRGQENSRKLVWALEELPPLSKQKLELDIAARVDGPLDLGIEWTLLPQTETVRLQTQQPRIELWIDGPVEVTRGDTPRYTVVVANPGTGPARDVEVLVVSSGGSGKQVPVGTIAPGESSSFQIDLSDLEPGATRLEAIATAALGIKSAAYHAIRVNKAELAITGLGPATHAVDAHATYQVAIRNIGSAVAQGVVATFDKPAGIVWADLPAASQQQKHQIVWPVGDLDPGQELSFTLTGQLVESGEQLLQFVARDQRGNHATVDLLTDVEPVADVQLTVLSDRTRLPVGEETYCDIVVENRGSQAAENVSVAVDFASGIHPIQATGLPADISLGDITFEPIARLAPGERATLRVAVRGKQPGAHDFRVAVTSADGQIRLAHEGTIQCYQAFTATPGVQMRVISRNTNAQVGEEVQYDIELKNTSNHSISELSAAIHFSPGFEPIAVQGASARISDGSVVFESLGPIERSSPRIITVTARASRPGRHTYLAELRTANRTSQASSGSTDFFTARRTNTSRIVR